MLYLLMHLDLECISVTYLVELLRIINKEMIRTGGLDTISGEVVVGRQGGVQREAGAHAAQTGFVVTETIGKF